MIDFIKVPIKDIRIYGKQTVISYSDPFSNSKKAKDYCIKDMVRKLGEQMYKDGIIRIKKQKDVRGNLVLEAKVYSIKIPKKKKNETSTK